MEYEPDFNSVMQKGIGLELFIYEQRQKRLKGGLNSDVAWLAMLLAVRAHLNEVVANIEDLAKAANVSFSIADRWSMILSNQNFLSIMSDEDSKRCSFILGEAGHALMADYFNSVKKCIFVDS